MKRDKVPFWRFYFGGVARVAQRLIGFVAVNVFRFWWCDGCETLHGPRVVKHTKDRELGFTYCSLHIVKVDTSKFAEELTKAIKDGLQRKGDSTGTR